MRAWTAGELADHAPSKPVRSRDEVVAAWERLRGEGLTQREAADRLGMTYVAFKRALQRARKDAA